MVDNTNIVGKDSEHGSEIETNKKRKTPVGKKSNRDEVHSKKSGSSKDDHTEDKFMEALASIQTSLTQQETIMNEHGTQLQSFTSRLDSLKQYEYDDSVYQEDYEGQY